MREILGKNLIVAQSGGPTAVINSSVCGIVDEASRQSKIRGIYGAINGVAGVLGEDIVDLRVEDPAVMQKLRKTPSAALGSSRYKPTVQDCSRIIEVLRAHEVGYFLFAGGNDSMDSAHKIAQVADEKNYDLQVIGVPKTVDNDLTVTDHCPGYGSVARFQALATRDAGLDTEAIYTSDAVKIIETMGRDTGWIAASTALAKNGADSAPHLIYLPERPFIMARFLEDVRSVYDRLGRAIICVCEGLKDEQGHFLKASSTQMDTDNFGHVQLGGVGDYLASSISQKLKIKARCDKPGTIQRVSMVCASQVDLDEAYRVGQVAVSRAVDGENDKMVTLVRKGNDPYACETGLVDLAKVALKTKSVPEAFINTQSNYVTDSFLEYVKPLIGDRLLEYAHLKKQKLEKRLPDYA